jgi:RNA polymerase sigma-70 factor, ECF subfamily
VRFFIREEMEAVQQEIGAGSPAQWAIPLVERLRSDDVPAIEELYAVLGKGLGFRFRAGVNLDPGDRFHDLYLAVLDSIRSHGLRKPERLMSFARTLARRQLAAHIKSAIRERHTATASSLPLADQRMNPEQGVIAREKLELARSALNRMPVRQREVLIRFYLREQPKERICREMNLSETQFRLMKSRAKARLSRALGGF